MFLNFVSNITGKTLFAGFEYSSFVRIIGGSTRIRRQIFWHVFRKGPFRILGTKTVSKLRIIMIFFRPWGKYQGRLAKMFFLPLNSSQFTTAVLSMEPIQEWYFIYLKFEFQKPATAKKNMFCVRSSNNFNN